ncbi:hypothetical protein [Streptomyces violaceusniger]|uniref:hypothetical protein n=1 Tax=Streptomyces violaceusniger TaxID=68280 RepID=UPI0002E54252|nr:hypothetical protein [Streptomyces violaceusniger]
MHELIAAPFLGHRLLVCPGSADATRLPVTAYRELETAAGSAAASPGWLVEMAR